MARGYSSSPHPDEESGRIRIASGPRRPARRADSYRDGRQGGAARGGEDGGVLQHPDDNYGYSSSNYAPPAAAAPVAPPPPPSSSPRPGSSSYTGGHYAESPILMPAGSEKNLAIVPPSAAPRQQRNNRSRSRNNTSLRRTSSEGPPGASNNKFSSSVASSTLPHTASGRNTRQSQRNNNNNTISKVTRSRSLTSRPAGIAVYHPPGYEGRSGAHSSANTELYHSRPATRMSTKSGRSHATSKSGRNGGNSTKAGVVVETMSAPNPFCPNTRGVCCLMVLVNLALILIAIGFIIVLQLHDPAFVWNIGVVILVFGFFTIFVALVYCMCICQESAHPRHGQPPQGELYWTHHWQKNITIPELKTGRDKERWEEQDRFPEDDDVDDDLSDTSSRDYPRLYLESDYGQRTDREADFETDKEAAAATAAAGTGGGQSAAPRAGGEEDQYGGKEKGRRRN